MLKLGSQEQPVFVDPEQIVAVQPADANTTLVHIPGGALVVAQPFAAVVQVLGYEQASS